MRLLQAYPGETLPQVTAPGLGSPEPKSASEGTIYFYTGDYARAYEGFDSIRWQYEANARNEPDSVFAHAQLAALYAMMGWKEPALAEIARATEVETAANIPLQCRAIWATTYGWMGDLDRAWPELERLLASRSAVYINDLRLDPGYDPFRKDPRFQKLIAGTKP